MILIRSVCRHVCHADAFIRCTYAYTHSHIAAHMENRLHAAGDCNSTPALVCTSYAHPYMEIMQSISIFVRTCILHMHACVYVCTHTHTESAHIYIVVHASCKQLRSYAHAFTRIQAHTPIYICAQANIYMYMCR